MLQLPRGKASPTPRQRFNRKRLLSFLLAFFLVAAFSVISPWTRPLVNEVRVKWNLVFNHNHAYQSTEAVINKALTGTRYSAMHNAPAGVTVIFNVPAAEANQLRDPTYDFSASPTFRISNDVYQDIRQLQNSYAVSLPKNRIAAVISRIDITSTETLKVVLQGLQVSQLGPNQDAGAFLIYGNDQPLIQRLSQQKVIRGRLQTTHPPDESNLRTVTIPLDKHQEMGVVLGHRH